MDRTQEAIDQVKQIFPDFGEGYIEAALQCYSMNVEETVTRLLDPKSLHPRLRTVDKKLPRAKPKGNSAAPKARKDQEDEAKAVQKRYMREVQEREERDALIAERLSRNLNLSQGGTKSTNRSDFEYDLGHVETYDDKDPYDDDYDDQFDDMGDQHIGVGTAGTSFLADTDDYESVKRYNAMMKEDEQEEEFWDESRNMNRQVKGTKGGGSKNDDADHDESEPEGKKWGPDKAKGGRILGPDGKPIPRTNNRNRSRQREGSDGRGKTGPRGNSPKDQSNEASGGNKAPKKAGQKGQKQGEHKNGGGDGSEMSVIEKRRKNDNKAKIGNHNRKDRALKKGARGM